MAYSSGFTMNTVKLTKALKAFTKKGKEAIDKAIQEEAKSIEQYMKANAPWQDRTGAARKSLKATAERKGLNVSIKLSNPVEYGIYLEQGMEKRFAIIDPTIKVKAPQVMEHLAGVFNRL